MWASTRSTRMPWCPVRGKPWLCGTTTCEIKSGYGLEPELELKQLRAIRALSARTPVDVWPTLLAHVIPPAERHDRATFVGRFCDEVIRPAASEGLARFFDVFIEGGAYTPDEALILIAVAKACDLGIKLHVDQLSEGAGAALAAQVEALSADHLEKASTDGLKALARGGVTACILPGCRLFLGKDPWPDGRGLRDAGCEVAVATDCNPGSSMIGDLTLCGSIAATCCGLSLEEALWGMTRGGAKALGLSDRGRLVAGERADFVVVRHADWRALLYQPGAAPIGSVYVGGKAIG